ncbi:hypothetical protein PR048_002427 [Dryococelus australis]|uniref:Uncharacterized protein n=1 Tax=Dryococelus australis TaxID=614101 RepID=A0ABQ9IL72_9NEOP|nr:hypothetical protein PR048_002427 [Dryococelus australis]
MLQEMELRFLQNTVVIGVVSACASASEVFMTSEILGSLAEAYITNSDALIRLTKQCDLVKTMFTTCTRVCQLCSLYRGARNISFSTMKRTKTILHANMTSHRLHD